MVDIWGDALASAGLVAGIVAGFAAWFNWQQLKAIDAQLYAEREKVGHLGNLVAALLGMVETQKQQLAALMVQNQIPANALQVRQQEFTLQAAKLAWQTKGPFEKAATLFDKWRRRTFHSLGGGNVRNTVCTRPP